MPRAALALIALLILAACHSRAAAPAPATPKPLQDGDIVDASRPAVTIQNASPADAANVVAATYRVRPDRRFLYAVADIYTLSTGKHGVVRIDFDRDHWLVSCDGREAGVLPE